MEVPRAIYRVPGRCTSQGTPPTCPRAVTNEYELSGSVCLFGTGYLNIGSTGYIN